MEFLVGLNDRGFTELLGRYGGDSSLAFSRVLRLVEKAGCQTVIIEDSPQEEEYKSEHKALYRHVMAAADKVAVTRLHFVRDSVHSLNDIQHHDPRYLGYCDLRPTAGHTISDALIDLGVFVSSNRDYLFVTCQREFEVPLGNAPTQSVKAFPYMQQDGTVVRCAQAALASVARYFDARLTGPDFTEIGKTYPSGIRAIPSRGLVAAQMGLGIEKMGREPIIHD